MLFRKLVVFITTTVLGFAFWLLISSRVLVWPAVTALVVFCALVTSNTLALVIRAPWLAVTGWTLILIARTASIWALTDDPIGPMTFVAIMSLLWAIWVILMILV